MSVIRYDQFTAAQMATVGGAGSGTVPSILGLIEVVAFVAATNSEGAPCTTYTFRFPEGDAERTLINRPGIVPSVGAWIAKILQWTKNTDQAHVYGKDTMILVTPYQVQLPTSTPAATVPSAPAATVPTRI